ncbi:MAG: ATP-binding domain-containing protein [Lachnospiraceae bacterium]|nr:ATP-binding domain-containing protein [Lachnospiraceae bacterium]
MTGDLEYNKEIEFFNEARLIIGKNITAYEFEYEKRHDETRELLKALHGGDVELYDRMVTSRSLEENAENQLRKNQAAWNRPYFGRIDYTDIEIKKTGKDSFADKDSITGKDDTQESLYIGRNGVFKNRTEIIVADWRAPVSSVYYENEIGPGSYLLPDETAIPIELHLKRTYDIEAGQLNGYYDSDVTANDDLLVKYLSKNKEAVLGEIIATIQKEQNAIIRESPYANLIVQGVAGSGKTTVAIHRMSYILYNYKERFEPNEFCVVGSSDILLDYITSGLPELDVSKNKRLRMDELFIKLLRKEWKDKYKLVADKPDARERSGFDFMQKLEQFLRDKKASYVSLAAVNDNEFGILITESGNYSLYHENEHYSAYRLLMTMDERIMARIKSLIGIYEKEEIDKRRKKYRRFCLNKFPKVTVTGLYQEFLESLSTEDLLFQTAIKKGCFDIYDIAAMVLIYYRIFQKTADEEFSLLFIDEAQDFGSSLYYVLKQVLPACYFTIMGDVSQNINYETGMNDWQEISSFFLTGPKDKFKLLAKSYRNTIEISEYAGQILEKASAGLYKITPVIRHGLAVCEEEFWGTGEMAARVDELTGQIRGRGYQTIAVICRDEGEAEKVRLLLNESSGLLAPRGALAANSNSGLTILPVRLVKGLEFDAVILWNPERISKLSSPKEAKLLYVAATRALHELYVLRC